MAHSKSHQIKEILINLAINDELPLDMNELDAGIFDEVFDEESDDSPISFAGWNTDDVITVAEDNEIELTEEQAVGVIELMIRKADASLGVGHDTISYWIGVYLENFEK